MERDYRFRQVFDCSIRRLRKLLPLMILRSEPQHTVCVLFGGSQNLLQLRCTHIDLQVISAPKLAQSQSLGLQAKDWEILFCFFLTSWREGLFC